MPGLVDVLAKIVGVWSSVVSYLKETRRKSDGDRLVVRSSLVGVLFLSSEYCTQYCCVVQKKGLDG